MASRVFRLGDVIRITSGPFANFSGRLDGINQAKALLKVTLKIYGRVTPVKVNFQQAEKVEFETPKSPGSATD